ncbi:MAG: histidine phosphatase family protein [Candidatus Buchananbacteria bacterium]|nr:histidine phosphatase family protein [Candidatus Buchananbacteria bacterium]
MRVQVYFVRHAEAQTNADPLFKGEDTLTDLGVQQANLLANCFTNIPIETIYSSPTLRAQLTSKVIEQAIGIAPTNLEYLKERKGSYSQDKIFIHSEAFADFKIRLAEFKKLLEHSNQKYTLVVGHAIYLKSFAAYLMIGDSLTEDLLLKIESTLTIDNAAISKFMYNQEKGKWHLELWNDQKHLNVSELQNK